jgi:hypothetical protein
MIDSVRKTVLAIANKQNYGYIPPSDFNLYAKQAQLDVFEDIFYQYNLYLTKRNTRLSSSEYIDIAQKIEDIIDLFQLNGALTKSGDVFTFPEDYYMLTDMFYGTNVIDRVSNNKIMMLRNSNLTSPSTRYPVYTLMNDHIHVYPEAIAAINIIYVRNPKEPMWTYRSIANGEPMFDRSSADYQDFEMPSTYEPLLVSKILQYIGISLRDKDVYTAGITDEQIEEQKTNR